MASVSKNARRATERRLKNPLRYSAIVDVAIVRVPNETLLSLIDELDADAGAVDDALHLWIDEFGARLGFLVGSYMASVIAMKVFPTLSAARKYARRLEKYVRMPGAMPSDPQHWPPMVRYDTVNNTARLEAVHRYMMAVDDAKAPAGKPQTTDKDRLILDTFELVTSYGVRQAPARQYTELILKASGVKVPKLGDRDGRGMRQVAHRPALRAATKRANDHLNRMAYVLVKPGNKKGEY